MTLVGILCALALFILGYVVVKAQGIEELCAAIDKKLKTRRLRNFRSWFHQQST
jgi:hypothetical protein